MGKNKDKQTYQKGLRAELLSKLWLWTFGYSILEQRYKTPMGEIDLIARKGKHIAFIEIKYRQTFEEAAYSITDHQKKRINKAALLWLAKEEQLGFDSLSFDVILVSPWKLPHHIKNAFEEL